jgi:hypothetical protein
MTTNNPNSTKTNHLLRLTYYILVEKLQGMRVSLLFMQVLQPFLLLMIELLTETRTPLTTHVQQGQSHTTLQ